LYSLAQTQGLFPVSEGWTDSHKITGKSLDNFRIEANETSSILREKIKNNRKFYSPIEIVDLIYGEPKEMIKFGDSTDEEKMNNHQKHFELEKKQLRNINKLNELKRRAGWPAK
jgi:hypothetical protein